MNGSGLALLAAGALALAGASRRGGRNVPSVPPEVLEEAREASEVFRKNARAWMKGLSEDYEKEDYELNWFESELLDLFGRRLLGYGTYRLALASRDRRFIVKLSMIPAQNLREARAWRDAGPKTKEILVPVLAFDPRGHWLVMERVVPYADPEDDWNPSIRALVQRAREVGVEDVRAENISSDFRVLDYGQAKSLKGSPDRNSGPSRGSANEATQRWFHLTDRAKFKLSATYKPRDNSLSIVDRSGRQGVYLARELEPWLNGHGYWRPFVVEFEVDPSVKLDPGVHGRWGGELFVPASSFGKLRVRRVIPLDAYAREVFGDHGWVEGWEGRAFDTGESISAHRGPPAMRGYHYDGPDVRDMGVEEVSRHKRRLRAFVKARYR